jgi:CIC family chloride channel protein
MNQRIDNILTLTKNNLALIFVAILTGIIVSLVAQFFIISAKAMFRIIFYSDKLALNINFFNINLNITPFFACILASILVCLLIKFFKIQRWHGPADTIYAAHQIQGNLDIKTGFLSTIASFVSISGGASVGIYGPLVHFGGTLGAFLRRIKFVPNIPHDIIIGSGVAAAISAGFGSPLAGIIFAHEVVLRHYSLKAITSVALCSVVASFTADKIGLVGPPFKFLEKSFEMSSALPGLALVGITSALIAFLFMKSIFLSSKIAQKSNIKSYYLPLIPGAICGLVGIFLPEALGLGINTILNTIINPTNFMFLLILLFFKLFLTSSCIGFGLFGGVFSPALFLGTMTGAIIYNIPGIGLDISLLSVFAVAGMASVASSVIGAPISAIILVLELTGSYEYAIAAILPISFCSLITYLTFGSSFFDAQLKNRGINMGDGRQSILMNQTKLLNYTDVSFTKFNKETTINEAINKFKKHKTTEGYMIDSNKKYLGKVRLIDLLGNEKDTIFKYRQKNHLILEMDSNILETLKSMTEFVGESIPVINHQNNTIHGIISENDILKAYIDISEAIKSIEK